MILIVGVRQGFGTALGSDLEFTLVDNNCKKEHQHLQGKKIKNQLIMVMAAQDEKQDGAE